VKLDNAVAVITGSARNIGRATALELASLGYHIVLHTRNDEANLQQTIELVRATGVDCEGVIGPLDTIDTIDQIEEATRAIGPCQVLVNNASVRKTKPFLETTLDEWHEVFRINCDAQFLCTQRFLPDMLKANWGRVICLGGLSAHTGAIERAAVVTSKSSVPGLVRALAVEFSESNVTFNCVVPGHIEVERSKDAGARLKHPNFEGKKVPYGQPEDVARVIAMLVGPDSGFVTGQTIHVNGGAFLP
jgi:3-oxoacyl-[acyl-carrier protein] reductase